MNYATNALWQLILMHDNVDDEEDDDDGAALPMIIARGQERSSYFNSSSMESNWEFKSKVVTVQSCHSHGREWG